MKNTSVPNTSAGQSVSNQSAQKLSSYKNQSLIFSVIVALGIVYGDIGTSPLYVMKAIIDDKIISEFLILGSLSCVFWTLTLQTTLKYVVLILRADRKGQGGLLALYSLIKKGRHWWLVFFAIVGTSMLIADGLITPAISVSSAVEGLQILYPEIKTLPIVISILFVLFSLQKLGTNIVGGMFGIIVFIWFSMIGSFGLMSILGNPDIIRAVNPIYAYQLLTHYPQGFWLLGAVFLCSTGAEALYSDLGHCDRKSIRLGWIFVKTALLLNYFGQGAWLLSNATGTIVDNGVNPFYSIIPEWFLLPSIIIATSATTIASQALISGSFTVINEATRQNLWPKIRTNYPTDQKGQIFMPMVNWFLCFGCIAVTLYFGESSNMEAAYGLAVVTTMICTTFLFIAYLVSRKVPKFFIYLFASLYLFIEGCFLIANLAKFIHGGWIVLLVASVLFFIMWVWYQAKIFKRRHTRLTDFHEVLPLLIDLSNDNTIPKIATHLVYMTSSDSADEIETKIMYSLLERQPKRADMYWFVHIEIVDEPYLYDYKVEILAPHDAVRIDFRLGFRVEPRIQLFFNKVLEELVRNGEIKVVNHYEYKKRQNIFGDARFVFLKKFISNYHYLPFHQRFIISAYYLINKIAVPESSAFGIDNPDSIIIEKVPITFKSPMRDVKLNRVYQ
ncbi:MAG: potassium transporter Kup [Rickettsiaceae bacterium]|jgi:KUP system potassium uptake protein|nr:potassium transporter Kup [Rickettsiaceae bacterium]